MIGMGTTETTTTPDYSNVMSDFAVTCFAIILGGMYIYAVGFASVLAYMLTKQIIGL